MKHAETCQGEATSHRGSKIEPQVKHNDVKTRRQLLEAYLSREEFHREKHYDFCSKQVLSVYTTFPRFLFPREDHRGKELRRVRSPMEEPGANADRTPLGSAAPPPVAAKEDSVETQETLKAETSTEGHLSSGESKSSEIKTAPGGPFQVLDPWQRSWGCAPRFPRLAVPPEVQRPVTVPSGHEAEETSIEVRSFKLVALPVPTEMALLKRPPAYSFGLYPKGVSRSKATDFRKLRDAVDFDESKLLEAPRPSRPGAQKKMF